MSTPRPAAPATGTPPPRQPPSPPEADELQALRHRLRQQLLQLLPAEGMQPSATVPELLLMRADQLNGSVCGQYEPCVAVIVQGAKRVVVGDDSWVYDSQRYLITSLDLPAVATLLQATPERPYLAVALRLDLQELANLMLDLPPPHPALAAADPSAPRAADPSAPRAADDTHERRAMATGALTVPLLDAFARLLDVVQRPQDAAVLAPLLRREIHYRLLTGETGARLRHMATAGSQGRQIAGAIARLKNGYAQPLRVEDLAREVRMSVSSFHHHFKALTAMSPLQYQKQLRLAEARRLMLAEHLDAATAAYRVGYESASQFSREYSRQFGAPPSRDMAALRGGTPAPLAAGV